MRHILYFLYIHFTCGHWINGQMNRAMLLMLHTLNAVWNNDVLIVFVIFTSDGWFASHHCFLCIVYFVYFHTSLCIWDYLCVCVEELSTKEQRAWKLIIIFLHGIYPRPGFHTAWPERWIICYNYHHQAVTFKGIWMMLKQACYTR